MKKLLFIVFILIAIAVILFGASSRYGIKLGDLNITGDSVRQELEGKTINFLEDIQFKDFVKAATYHSSEEQKQVDIPRLIEEKFMIKPELLDITKYEVKQIDIDRSGTRAKVKTRTIFKVLNTSEVKDMEIIFYFHKANDGKWYMELESSLK